MKSDVRKRSASVSLVMAAILAMMGCVPLPAITTPAIAPTTGSEATGTAPTPGPTTGYTSNGFGGTPADYARVGLQPDIYQLWEDGFRTADTNYDPNVYEWWYSDFTDPDGADHRVVKTYEWNDFFSATDRCDVRVGPFTFAGNLKTYHMRGAGKDLDGEDLALDLTLTSLVSPFRPGTGFSLSRQY
jgi:hypothetical protein